MNNSKQNQFLGVGLCGCYANQGGMNHGLPRLDVVECFDSELLLHHHVCTLHSVFHGVGGQDDRQS